MEYVIKRDEDDKWYLEVRDTKTGIISSRIYASTTTDILHFAIILDGTGICPPCGGKSEKDDEPKAA